MLNCLAPSLKRLTLFVSRAIFFVLIAFVLVQEYPPPGDFETQIDRAVGNSAFDFVQWENEALVEKATQITVPIQDYLTSDQQRQLVLDYMQLTTDWSALDAQIRNIYADASVADPAATSVDLRAKRDATRAEIERRRPTAEAILQQQISSVLADEGFAAGGEIVPPVASRITPLPYVLIVSPRDEINRVAGIGLQAGMNVDQAEQIEQTVLSTTNRSALVVPIGGLAAYPTMILETDDLLWLLQTMSHEWTHNWLDFRPLGYSYLAVESPDIRTINETVASLVGDEVGLIVMRRYYLETLKREHPDLVEPKPLQVPPTEPAATVPSPSNSNEFSFSRTMHDTRVKVDDLLAEARAFRDQAQVAETAGHSDDAKNLRAQHEAKIVEAEKYMEQQRQIINSHGYRIRKINQAYFAFYGAYADQPGAAGRDPVGPNVIALRVYSSSLRAFLDRVSRVLTVDQLKQAVEQLKELKEATP